MNARATAPAVLALVCAAVVSACDARSGRDPAGRDRALPGERRMTDVAPRPPEARDVPCEVPGTTAKSAMPPRATTWRVRQGDTLAGIAKRCYGDERLWPEIVRANPRLAREPGAPKLHVGTLLVVPDVVR